jgi:hypothetical protein
MPFSSFHELYESDAQSVYALWLVPLLFLAFLLLTPTGRAAASTWRPGDASFLRGYMIFFGLETILDPFATGPFLRSIGQQNTGVGTTVLLTFVLLGDFRVFLLLFRMARPERPLAKALLRAAAWTFIVPIAAYATDSALRRLRPDLPSQSIWLVYELFFLAMALWLRGVGLPAWVAPNDPERRRGLRAIAAYVATYYALWALADVLILVFGLDLGWLLRVIPNQLYYAFFLPFAWFQIAGLR